VTALAGTLPSDERTLPEQGSVLGFVDRDGAECRLNLLVEGAHCAACIQAVEGAVAAEPGVTEARLNLTLRRLTLRWHGDAADADRLAARIEAAGYKVVPFDPEFLEQSDQQTWRSLLRALAVAGFAASNAMMLSIPVWVGFATDMAEGTRLLLQAISGLVAVPAVLYGGRLFYQSAWNALRAGRTNIDVPITLGLLLTLGISMVELLRGGPHVYFDSAASLLFVLLLGRVLEFRVRARARQTLEQFLLMQSRGATRVMDDGTLAHLRAADILPGMVLLVRPGEQVPVDGTILSGHSEMDRAAVTGEPVPLSVAPGDALVAGMINGGGALHLRADRAMADSHLAEMARLVEAAETRRGHMVALADKVSAIWTPIIHACAAGTFLYWLFLGGAGFATSLLYAVAVLIIACPCAIGLAVPAVQVVSRGALLRRGILLRGGDVLERLAAVNRVVLDKTGTLTEGRPRLLRDPSRDPAALSLAAGLAAHSLHPLARALAAAMPAGSAVELVGDVREVPGAGLEWQGAQGAVRLGSAGFCGVAPGFGAGETEAASTVWLSRPGVPPVCFRFADTVRAEAAELVADLKRAGLAPSILSGDAQGPVAELAKRLDVPAVAAADPATKLAALEALRAQGAHVLMVGDGVNDAPALAGADVSASFTHGAPVSQCAADIVLPAGRLTLLPEAMRISRRALGLMRQNMIIAAIYNAALVPVAMTGHVTPLAAAIAMSVSSLTVTLNALRAGWGRWT
jgi:Cu2+-exporting ATPase